MRWLIALALLAVAHAAPQYFNSFAIPTVLPDGHLADTPEVAAAKIAHFTHHANNLAASSAPAAIAVAPATFAAAPAAIAAPAAFASAPAAFAAAPAIAAPVVSRVATAAPAVVDSPYFRSFYSGAYTIPTVLPNSGHLADSAEVAVTKALHLAEQAKSLSLTAF